jgi:gamma-glutamyltranspeptidase/glutathione hydrolase
VQRCLIALLLWSALGHVQPAAALDLNQPEEAVPEAAASAPLARAPAGLRRAVASAHPLASEAGRRILREGGNAVDAAVAVQAMLGLVEPQSSGLGGGAFLVLADRGALTAWDGRETAPATVRDDLFLDADGQPLPFEEAVPGGRSVGVPGVLRMLEAAHRRHGRLPWRRLFAPAIESAEQGFPIGLRLAGQIAHDPQLARDPAARRYFFDADGRPWPAGHRLRNPDYAALLRAVARRGADAFYTGTTARAVVQAVRRAPDPGRLATTDLARYRAIRREVLCYPWREVRLCGMPPPSAGLLVIGQVLGTLEASGAFTPTLAPAEAPWPATFLHPYIEAARLAQADRDAYVADPDRIPAPAGRWSRLWDPAYLAGRAARIGPRAADEVPPGRPDPQLSWASDRSGEVPATSHFSIVDGDGQVLAMTSSIESQFGSRRLVNRGVGRAGGFLLNNELTDFSFAPQRAGRPVANRVEPGKRPRSSMSPVLVLDAASGEVIATLGSPGGPPIPHYVLKALIQWRIAGLPLQAAFDAPNLAPLGPAVPWVLVERDRWPAATLQALRELGHPVREVPLTSGLHGLVRRSDGRWDGAADRRREGTVAGD